MANKASSSRQGHKHTGLRDKADLREVKEHIKIKWKKKIPDGNCKYEKTGNKLQYTRYKLQDRGRKLQGRINNITNKGDYLKTNNQINLLPVH